MVIILAMETIDFLLDTFTYTATNWLRLSLSKQQEDSLSALAGACAYLFHKRVLGEDIGKEITSALEDCDPASLRKEAVNLQLGVSPDALFQGGTPFKDYFLWIRDAVPEAKLAGLDFESSLVLSLADRLTEICLGDNVHINSSLVAEVCYLQSASALRELLLTTAPEKYHALRSYPFFEEIASEHERIRSEILD